MKLSAHLEKWPLRQPFRIAGVEWRNMRCLVVELADNGSVGRGEAQGVYYLEETAESIYAQARSVARAVEGGLTRNELQDALPHGGARNALDCAMWDLECRQRGRTIWELTGIESGPVTTVVTIGMESSPEAMAEKAAAARGAPILKIKLDADAPLEKIAAIRAARPDARLVVDANQAWDEALLQRVLAGCVALGVEMVEQPLRRGHDEMLRGRASPVTLAADESCLHSGELAQAATRYDMVNIKLDKAGGLTEALAVAAAARRAGCRLMVGNMLGTSLGMAPSFVLAQLCDYVDIDGPLLLEHDRPHGMRYDNGTVDVFDGALWGGSQNG